ncbi:hypothetical protein ACIP5Y_26595 [Nocardia sp. NPDC088792]
METLEWSSWITIPSVVLAGAVALALTVRRMHLSQRALKVDDVAG